MKRNIFLILVLCGTTFISAQTTNDDVVSIKPSVFVPIKIITYEVEPQKSPLHICSIFPWGIHGKQSMNHIYNFSFSLVAGKVRGINGLQISGLYSQAPDAFNGLQVAGLGGNSAGRLKGVQIGGVTNYTIKTKGIQISGFANATAVDAMGLQISGVVNDANHIKGVQIAGIGNAATNMKGIQIAGISNIAQNMTGLQISGTYNRNDTLRGLNIAIASFADTIAKGISLSLINIVKKGFYKEWELEFADHANVAFSYKMGTQKFYTLFTTGIIFIEEKMWTTGVGFGNRTPLWNRLDFQPEAVVHIFSPINFNNIQNAFETRLKFGFVYCINEKFGFTIAPSVYTKNNQKIITAGFGISLGLKIIKI